MHYSEDALERALKFVRRRCPDLNEEELQEAAHNWLAYMEIVWKISQRRLRERQEPEEGILA
jgi:hypothetical protein